MDEKYMMKALKEAEKAYKRGDVPVGAVIVENEKILSTGYNNKESKKIATKHAEVIAIERACKKKKSWYLDNCTLYVTMEPCIMCCGAILQSRIKRIVYATENDKFGGVVSVARIFEISKNNHTVNITSDVCKEEASIMLKKFFKEQRNK